MRIDDEDDMMSRGDVVIKYTFPPSQDDKFLILVVVYEQNGTITGPEIQRSKHSLKQMYEVYETKGVYWSHASWRRFAPYVSSGLIIVISLMTVCKF